MLEQMIKQRTQIGSLSGLEQMIAQGDLQGYLKAFLLSCTVEELSPASLRDYRQKLKGFVNFCATISKTRPEEITVHHIRLFLLKRQETCQAISVNDYYRCVKRFFNWMVEEGVLAHSPMANIRPTKVPWKLIQPFNPSQIEDLLTLCDGKFLGIRNRAIILTFLDTGLRLSELANIKLSELDFERETIRVMGKGARERVVRVGKKTQKALLRYLLMRNDGLSCLWVSEERRPLTAWGIQLMIRKLGKRAGISGIRCSPHTFRHTSATQSLRNGARDREVQSMLGHSTLTMTMRYLATINSEDAVISHKHFGPVDKMGLK